MKQENKKIISKVILNRGLHRFKLSVILNLIQDLLHFKKTKEVEIADQVRNDTLTKGCHFRVCGPQDSGISTLFPRPLRERVAVGGFTLLEILITVIIIAVLAAVALPAYQKAVVKSRLAALKAIVTPVAKEAEMYYLRNGVYPSRFSDLDVTMPVPDSKSTVSDQTYKTDVYYYGWGWCTLANGFGQQAQANGPKGQYFVSCTDTKGNIGYTHYFAGTKIYPTGPACGVRDGNKIALTICHKETGTTTPFFSDYAFSYSGKSTP